MSKNSVLTSPEAYIMTRVFTVFFFAMAMAFTSAQAQAGIVGNVITLNNAGAGLPNLGGSGTASVLFDDVTGFLQINGSFNGLTLLAIQGSVNGYGSATATDEVIPLTVTMATAGTFSGSGTVTDIAQFLNGGFWIRIDTPNFQPEIAGQIVVPEPGTTGLLALGGLFFLRRRGR